MASQYDIVVHVDASRAQRGIRQVDQGMRRAEAGANRLGRALTRAFGALGGAFAGRAFVQMADTMTNLQNRLRTVTSSATELAEVQERLFEIAQDTRAPLEATTELYARMATSAEELGLSQERLLGITRTLNQAVALSGATATEGANAIRQLAQGMSAGALRGEELNSVLENLPSVADLIAEHLGVTRGRLRELAEQGRLTTGVLVEAFERAADGVERDFGGSVQTVDQALTKLRNSFLKLVGDWDRATGASTTLAEAISLLADNLRLVARAIEGLLVVGTVTLAFRVLGPVAFRALEALVDGTMALSRVVRTEGAYIRSGLGTIGGSFRDAGALAVGWLGRLAGAIGPPIVRLGLLATAVAGVGLYAFAEEIRVSEDGVVRLSDVIGVLWDRVRAFAGRVAQAVVDFFVRLAGRLRDAALAVRDLLDAIESWTGAPVTAILKMHPLVPDIEGIMDEARDRAEARLRERRFRFLPEGARLELPDDRATMPPPGGGGGAVEESALQRANRELDRQVELLGMGRQEQERRLRLWDVEDDMRRAGLALGEREKAQLEERIRGVQSLTNAVQVATDAMESTFNHIGEAFADFAMTGKTSFKDMADAIIRDLLRIAVQAFVIKPLLEFGQGAVGSLLGGGAGGGLGAGGSIGSIVGGIFGSLLGFADGGRFVVGGAGGVDSQVVAFRATPGESVSVRTPAQDRALEMMLAEANRRPSQAPQAAAAGPTTVVVQNPITITNNTGEPVETRRTQGPGGTTMTEIIVGEVRGALSRGELDGVLNARHGLGPQTKRR